MTSPLLVIEEANTVCLSCLPYESYTNPDTNTSRNLRHQDSFSMVLADLHDSLERSGSLHLAKSLLWHFLQEIPLFEVVHQSDRLRD